MLKPVPKEHREEDRGFQEGGEDLDRHLEPTLDRRNEAPVEGLQPTLRPVITPSSVGATLAITREKFGQDLRQVAQALRIRLAYLEAIEDDRYSDLPGLTYAVGFVRSYSDYLGLDSKLMVQRYKEEAQGLNRHTQLVFPAPVQEGKVPTGAIILVALILVTVTYLGWTYFSDETQPPAPALVQAPAPAPDSGTAQSTNLATNTGGGAPADPAETQATGAAPQPETMESAPAPTETAAAERTPDPIEAQAAEEPVIAPGAAATATAETAATGESEAGTGSALAATPQPEAVSEPEVTPEAAAVPAAPTAPDSTDSAVQPQAGEQLAAVPPPLPAAVEAAHTPRLVIRATQDSWVQIRNSRDEAILTQVLREGDTYEVPEEEGLVLLTGNAGGIVLVVDGKDQPPLGAVGAVKRNVALDPDKLLEN